MQLLTFRISMHDNDIYSKLAAQEKNQISLIKDLASAHWRHKPTDSFTVQKSFSHCDISIVGVFLSLNSSELKL